MLNPVNQIGAPSPQIPLALLHQSDDDWLRSEPTVKTASDNHLPTQIPLAFVRRLITDDRLRAELEADPAETLRRQGLHVAPEQIPAAVSLPSPHALADALRLYATEEDKSSILRWLAFLGSDD